jgi:hypothetical protein
MGVGAMFHHHRDQQSTAGSFNRKSPQVQRNTM